MKSLLQRRRLSMFWLWLAASLVTSPFLGSTAGAVQSQAGAPIVDNPRVLVYQATLGGNRDASVGNNSRDLVVVSLARGAGSGAVVFEPKHSTKSGLPVGFGPDAIVVELKDERVPSLRNTSGYPNAFPRPGSKKMLDNERVLIWDYTWAPGVPTPMHFHDKDVVVVYLADGALKSTAPDGQSVLNEHYFGFTKFNARDRAHTETLVKGSGRAIILELK